MNEMLRAVARDLLRDAARIHRWGQNEQDELNKARYLAAAQAKALAAFRLWRTTT
jgi:hypothetical protein